MCDSRTEHVTWRSVTRPWMTRRQEEAFVPPLGWSCRKRDPASKQSPYSHRGLACNPSYKILPTLLFTEAPALLRQQLIPPEPFPGYNGKAYLCLNSKPPYSRPVDFRNNQSGRLPKSDINIPDAAPRNLISSLLAELETNESCYLVCGINVVLFQHSPEAHTL